MCEGYFESNASLATVADLVDSKISIPKMSNDTKLSSGENFLLSANRLPQTHDYLRARALLISPESDEFLAIEDADEIAR